MKNAISGLDIKAAILGLAAFGFVLVLYGAVPFQALPTLGQAVWMTGFSQSFVNQGLGTAYATNFGFPEPAAIAFGLAGAYPAALFIGAGLHPADAYALMFALWLGVAFAGAWHLGNQFGLQGHNAALSALLWLSMPIVLRHTGYSALALGIALLPFYFSTAFSLFGLTRPRDNLSARIIVYFLACLIAVFMDGYTFIMFAVGASIIAIYAFYRMPALGSRLLKFAFPVHLLSVGVAYFAYSGYIGKAGFEPASLEFFRGWGLDLSFVVIPTQGMLWFWDVLGVSIPRTTNTYFGDGSVWNTTFALPLVVAGLVSWGLVKRKEKMATGVLLLATFSLWLAMGPSVKIMATKPSPMGPLMAEEFATAPTGNGFLYENVPGFRNMRATYRWSALGLFALWFLLILCFARYEVTRRRWWTSALLVVLIAAYMPNIAKELERTKQYRESLIQIDRDLVLPLSRDVAHGELVAFLPFGNDFLVNYLASRSHFTTFNVGGDKNLAEARKHWPASMKSFSMSRIGPSFVTDVLILLARRDVDVVVFPYIDSLYAAHTWPGDLVYRKDLLPAIERLRQTGYVEISKREYYAVARLTHEATEAAKTGSLVARLRETLCIPPMCLRRDGFTTATLHQVGNLVGTELISEGKRGFLLYGPYVRMDSGRYELTLKGTAEPRGDSWVDVVSTKGSKIHARFPLRTGSIGNLGDGAVEIDGPVKDLEVRVHVGEGDQVRIAGYELRRKRAGTPSTPPEDL